MIWQIVNKRSPLFWLVFHSVLGALSTITPWFLIVWFYFVLLTTLPNLITKTKGTFVPLIFVIVYVTSFELLARMSSTSPFVPYELGKYIFFLLLCFGILKGFRHGQVGWLMFIFLLPAAFFDTSGETTYKNIIFNLVGPINVALAVVVFKGGEFTPVDLLEVFRLMLYPLISVLAFAIFMTPDLEKVEFSLKANFETSGGFGSNQVSTALGLGAFIVFVFWRYNWILTGYRWLDIIIFIMFVFRGLLTFSRGGMIGGALGIIIILAINKVSFSEGFIKRNPVKTTFATISVLVVIVLIFVYADSITGGKLALRYQGETPGTLAGTKSKTLNVLTTNRIQIFSDDLQLWKEYPVFGTGVGASRYMRNKTNGFLSHIEFSRLLSEHGLLGLLYNIILLALGIKVYRTRNRTPYNGLFLAVFFIALFTTFHAAMRTYISPLLFGLSMLAFSVSEGAEDKD